MTELRQYWYMCKVECGLQFLKSVSFLKRCCFCDCNVEKCNSDTPCPFHTFVSQLQLHFVKNRRYSAHLSTAPPYGCSELSTFIAAGRLNCKIDKVAGILETNRPDAKNALYQSTIKQGDLLLNRIQKLSRVIDV